MLKVEALHASYGRTEVLRDIAIQVNEGGVVCLLGANGAGKSTLLGCISGVVFPTRGRRCLSSGPMLRDFPPIKWFDAGSAMSLKASRSSRL